MPILTSTNRLKAFVLSEGEGTISRENVTVTQNGSAIVSGTVMGKITATGKYIPYLAAAVDGSQVAAGILYNYLPAATGDIKAVAFVRSCEASGVELTGLDVAGTTALKALNVIVRTATGLTGTY
jgi:hypothetical protein